LLHQAKKQKAAKAAASEATVSAILPAAIKTAAPVLYDQINQNEEKIEKLNEQI
jgi:hypothetical protein